MGGGEWMTIRIPRRDFLEFKIMYRRCHVVCLSCTIHSHGKRKKGHIPHAKGSMGEEGSETHKLCAAYMLSDRMR